MRCSRPGSRSCTRSSRRGACAGRWTSIRSTCIEPAMAMDAERKHVVVVGGGFAGLWAVRALASAPVRVTLLDRTNHHLFQPLLYQVATAGLSAPDIAAPLRHILRGQRNATVLMAAVTAVE